MAAVVQSELPGQSRALFLTSGLSFMWRLMAVTRTLNSMLDSGPILTDTETVMPTDIWGYLPVVGNAYVGSGIQEAQTPLDSHP